MNNDLKPSAILRKAIVEDDVYIIPKDKLHLTSDAGIVKNIDYLRTVLEALAGKQVWTIIDSLHHLEAEKAKRLIK